jgi:plastocyanin
MKFRPSYVLFATMLALGACKGNSASSSSTSAAPTEPAATASAASPVDSATAANIEGVVKFSGTKPAPQKIVMNADAQCKLDHPNGVAAQDVVINPNNTLEYVYVYVKSGLGNLKFPAPTTPVVLDQQGCLYSPHVVAVQVGQPIEIRNSDGVLHNVNVRPTKNQGFNIGQPIKGMTTTKTFTTPEVMIPVKCDVHPWMHGWIGVQDNPYASVTDDTGAFSLKNLPPGDYEIEAWHEKYGTATQKVTVGPKETKKIEFTFKGA